MIEKMSILNDDLGLRDDDAFGGIHADVSSK